MCHIDDNEHMVSNGTMEIVHTYPFLKSFLAGSVSGTCSTLLFQPLDLIKTRLQNGSKNSTPRNGMITLFMHVVRNEKVAGLWRGTVPSMLRCVPGVGMYFSFLHWLKTNFGSEDPSAFECLCFGALARSFAGATLLPVTVIKTRYESGLYAYNSLSEALCKIYKTEGRRGLFSGLAPTIIRDAPFSGIYLMFYTQAKKNVPSAVRDHVSAAPINFTCGLFAGILASGITQPADVIKTKMQLYPRMYSTVPEAIRIVFTDNGVQGFFRGIVPRVVRRTLMTAMAMDSL
ncbi:mitochondrial glycine transporter B-like [Uloborus diversus]|uniref:mitochondrial glycine transporter B-like n=1 Tax=Uloborus diversus TaxID=327109 RepID=UPI002409A1AF|nr:mitochondrial glycine transporter B-like [Uloborus diversus]